MAVALPLALRKPGSGIQVLEGDQATLNDAQRIQATGCRVVQVNTGVGCHLDAAMVARGLQMLEPPSQTIVLIENVGNLVCPALFDLGERAKVLQGFADAYKEKPSAVGITDQGALIEVLVGPTGTWTMVVTKPGGPACIVGTGHDWHMRPPPGTDHLV